MSSRTGDLPADELDALALLVERHRGRTGHDPWDCGAIAAQLANLEHDLATALAVALSAADDPRASTPHAITWTRHQPTPGKSSTTSATTGPTCRTCLRSERAHNRMAAATGDPHPFDPSRSTR